MENPVDKFLEMADIPEKYLDEDMVKKARDYAEAEIAVTIEDNLRIELGESRLWAGVDLPEEEKDMKITAKEARRLTELGRNREEEELQFICVSIYKSALDGLNNTIIGGSNPVDKNNIEWLELNGYEVIKMDKNNSILISWKNASI
jgi:hypothetical protein